VPILYTRKLLLCLVLIISILAPLTSYANPNTPPSITILYEEPNESLRTISNNIHAKLSEYNIASEIIGIKSMGELQRAIILSDSYIILYVFHGSEEGILGGSWREVAAYIEGSNPKHHILVTCHSDSLASNFALVWTCFVQPNQHVLMRHQEL